MMKFRLSCVLIVLNVVTAPIEAAMVAVSNLGQPNPSTVILGNVLGQEYQFATSFTTGASSVSLHSINLPYTGTYGGAASGYSLSLYSTLSETGPAGLVSTLGGSSTPASGLETYTPGSSITLLGNTTYWIVERATTTPPNTGFNTIHTSSAAEDAGGIFGWSIADHRWVTNNGGASWFEVSPNVSPRQFAVQVNAVADRGLTIGLLALSLAGLAAARRARSFRRFGRQT